MDISHDAVKITGPSDINMYDKDLKKTCTKSINRKSWKITKLGSKIPNIGDSPCFYHLKPAGRACLLEIWDTVQNEGNKHASFNRLTNARDTRVYYSTHTKPSQRFLPTAYSNH